MCISASGLSGHVTISKYDVYVLKKLIYSVAKTIQSRAQNNDWSVTGHFPPTTEQIPFL